MSDIYNWLLTNPQYIIDTMKIIENIICFSLVVVLDSKMTSQKALSASLDKTYEEFTLNLYQDSNFVVSKIQIHFSLHNITYFKYKATTTRKY